MDPKSKSRRQLLKGGAAAIGTVAAGASVSELASAKTPDPALPTYAANEAPMVPASEDVIAYGVRSHYVTSKRIPALGRPSPDDFGLEFHLSTPLQDSVGTIQASSLHYVATTKGSFIPDIDPAKHKLVIHGMVKQPLVFNLEDLERYPMVSRIGFVECGGNSAPLFSNEPIQANVQALHGLASCSEWTGVLLSTLLEEAGVDPKAKWIIAEGADSPHLTRSVPLAKVADDAMVAMYQNGERIQPGQGYPMRLYLPGYEGNMNVKYLRRLKLTTEPAMSYYESRTYAQVLPNGKSYRFYFLQEVKSFITSPSPGHVLKEPGYYEISGIAYSGTGRITKVMVSADGGKSWAQAALQEPVLPKAFTRFRMPWRWDGSPSVLQSRAFDESGTMQPTRAEFVALRGQTTKPPSVLAFPSQHFNAITSWAVDAKGGVRHVYA